MDSPKNVFHMSSKGRVMDPLKKCVSNELERNGKLPHVSKNGGHAEKSVSNEFER